jgi:ribosome-associated translation inhibitor RaiA
MDLDVRIHNNDPGIAVKNYAIRRMRFAMGRFASSVGRIVIRISDVNGARGGPDQCCRVTAEVLPSGRVVVEQVDADLFTAIDRACERVGQAFRRRIERVRSGRTQRESVRGRA